MAHNWKVLNRIPINIPKERLVSIHTQIKRVKVIRDSTLRFDAGRLLRKWRTNSKHLNLLWQQEGVETEFYETCAINLRPPIKILGLAWNPEKDLIYFDPNGSIEVYVT
ncbi:uncharacterized protein TNCV_2337131 [Trichonephila clavipes]|nr:uncharacterized protein TNCV_2337131 [Trichonephila clavipes]